MNVPASTLVANEVSDYKTLYKDKGAKAFWDKLRNDVDPYSVRQYLSKK
jgi:hypothetical protein